MSLNELMPLILAISFVFATFLAWAGGAGCRDRDRIIRELREKIAQQAENFAKPGSHHSETVRTMIASRKYTAGQITEAILDDELSDLCPGTHRHQRLMEMKSYIRLMETRGEKITADYNEVAAKYNLLKQECNRYWAYMDSRAEHVAYLETLLAKLSTKYPETLSFQGSSDNELVAELLDKPSKIC